MTANDLLGSGESAPSGMSLGSLFQRQSAQAGSRAEVYALKDRAGVLAQLEAPPVVLHVAESEKRKLPWEVSSCCVGHGAWGGHKRQQQRGQRGRHGRPVRLERLDSAAEDAVAGWLACRSLRVSRRSTRPAPCLNAGAVPVAAPLAHGHRGTRVPVLPGNVGRRERVPVSHCRCQEVRVGGVCAPLPASLLPPSPPFRPPSPCRVRSIDIPPFLPPSLMQGPVLTHPELRGDLSERGAAGGDTRRGGFAVTRPFCCNHFRSVGWATLPTVCTTMCHPSVQPRRLRRSCTTPWPSCS